MVLTTQILVYFLDGCRYGLPLSAVEIITPAVEITPVPDAPEYFLGVVNVHGDLIPVVSLRSIFRLAPREASLSDRFIIAHSGSQRLALLVDAVSDVCEIPEDDMLNSQSVLPSGSPLSGVSRHADGLILIHALDLFLESEQAPMLEEMRRAA